MQVDPFKLHSHSIKKPIEQKYEKIGLLVQDSNRYYPKDKNGIIDEWGAVVKQ